MTKDNSKESEGPPWLNIAPTRAPTNADTPPPFTGARGSPPSDDLIAQKGGGTNKHAHRQNSRVNSLDNHLGLGSMEEPSGPDG